MTYTKYVCFELYRTRWWGEKNCFNDTAASSGAQSVESCDELIVKLLQTLFKIRMVLLCDTDCITIH